MVALPTAFPVDGPHIDAHRTLHTRHNGAVYASEYADVNAAIADALTRGVGIVVLPSGVTPLGAAVDVSAGGTQPLAIVGNNTTLDARGLSDHALKCTATRSNLRVSDVTILAPTANYNAVHFDPGEGGYIIYSALERINVSGGGGYGFYLNNVYAGTWLNQLYAYRCRRGFYIHRGNAMAAGVLTARVCGELAVEMANLYGFHVQALYIESNVAEALLVHENNMASRIGTIYLENNNTGGAADYVCRFGAAEEADMSGLRGFGVGGLKVGPQENAPATAYIRAGRFQGLELAGATEIVIGGGVPLVALDAGVYNQCLALRNCFAALDVDLRNESADYPATLDNSHFTGAVLRRQ